MERGRTGEVLVLAGAAALVLAALWRTRNSKRPGSALIGTPPADAACVPSGPREQVPGEAGPGKQAPVPALPVDSGETVPREGPGEEAPVLPVDSGELQPRPDALEEESTAESASASAWVMEDELELHRHETGNVTFALPNRTTVLLLASLERGCTSECLYSEMEVREGVPAELLALSQGSLRLKATPNAGGRILSSEIASFELLSRMFAAELTKTETQIRYIEKKCSMTDYVCEVFGFKLGVSVTRAMHRGRALETRQQAHALLHKKLKGVNSSTLGVHPEDGWSKQMLHVMCPTREAAAAVMQEYADMGEHLHADTVVLVTVCENAPWLFNDKNDYQTEGRRKRGRRARKKLD